jgi:hypothetical protein
MSSSAANAAKTLRTKPRKTFTEKAKDGKEKIAKLSPLSDRNVEKKATKDPVRPSHNTPPELNTQLSTRRKLEIATGADKRLKEICALDTNTEFQAAFRAKSDGQLLTRILPPQPGTSFILASWRRRQTPRPSRPIEPSQIWTCSSRIWRRSKRSRRRATGNSPT